MNNRTYILVSKAHPGTYYAGNWRDTSSKEEALHYPLDEAMEQAKTLAAFGEYYRCERVREE